MAIVRLRGPLKKAAGDCANHSVEAESVGEALHRLEHAQPGIGGWILDERGQIRRHINVFVNGERAGEETSIGADDRIDVLPAISGGDA
jgi:sulfur-carrier protein